MDIDEADLQQLFEPWVCENGGCRGWKNISGDFATFETDKINTYNQKKFS